MYVYVIKKQSPFRRKKGTQNVPSSTGSSSSSAPTERSLKDTPEIRARIHLNHYLKFWGDVGSTVYFRSGPNRGKKRDKIPWTVVHVEMNHENVTWTNGGKVPNYIKLEGEVRGTKQIIWTCETQLINTGVKK